MYVHHLGAIDSRFKKEGYGENCMKQKLLISEHAEHRRHIRGSSAAVPSKSEGEHVPRLSTSRGSHLSPFFLMIPDPALFQMQNLIMS